MDMVFVWTFIPVVFRRYLFTSIFILDIYSTADISLNWYDTAIQFEENLELVGYIRKESIPKKFTMTYSYGSKHSVLLFWTHCN